MGLLSIYDITGIQDFIFSTNKVKENIGASIIVQKILDEVLTNSIEKVCKEKGYKYCIDWKATSNFSMISDQELQAEVIYIGGGNALVAYKDKDIAREINQEFSKKVLINTGGTLGIGYAEFETEFKNFVNDRKELLKKLAKNKMERIQTVPMLGIAITKQGVTDGLPAYTVDGEKNNISFPAYLKRKSWDDNKEYYDYLLPDNTTYKFPLEFDWIVPGHGDSHIAVVHIDGNNMGKKIDNAIKDPAYDKAVPVMRNISSKICKTYRGAMKEIMQVLIDSLKNKELYEKINIQIDPKDDKVILPLRPLIINGDDITFVIDGRIGIPLAEKFLEKISKQKITIDGHDISLSACAGVAIVKSHFPFYRAYELAEELTSSAKKKGKLIARRNESNECGSWIDFHIVHSGVTMSLTELRDIHYNIPGMAKVSDADYKIEEYGEVIMKFTPFNFLWRPWCVEDDCEEKYKWKKLMEIYNEFIKNWPRSKLKTLRNEFIKGEENIKLLLNEYKSRGNKLPKFLNESNPFIKNQTPYFDALELLDFYLPLN